MSEPTAPDHVVLGTRGSALALWQARHIGARLEALGTTVEQQIITTTGDRILGIPLAEIGDKGLFTKELDRALLDGRIDLAVHSLKDLPTRLPEGIALVAITDRAAPGDAFVAHPRFDGTLDDLPDGATLATSSLRRQAQLKAWRPDLNIVSVRGNVDTRLEKLDASDWHGMILAVAGLERLERSERIRQVIPTEIMLPAVGQGALGVVCAEQAEPLRATLKQFLEHPSTAAAATAERAFLRRLEGGCQVPIGAHAVVEDGHLRLQGCVASLDGSSLLRGERTGAASEADALGRGLAEDLLDQGAGAILAAIRAE